MIFKKKTKFITLFLILFISISYAVKCTPGYEETAVIQVLDGMNRPISTAIVQITYQVDKTTGKGYTITAPKQTDNAGVVSITFRNQEILQDRVDCEYTIIATYDNQKIEKKVHVDQHGPTIIISIPAYFLNIYLTDQYGTPISNGSFIVRNITKEIDQNGRASLLLGSGKAEVILKHEGGFVSKELNITEDTNYAYQVGLYNLTVYVFDDSGKPLEVKATIDNKIINSTERGVFSLKKLFTSKPILKFSYNEFEKTLETDLRVQTDYYVIYDIHAPNISNLAVREEQKKIIFSMHVADEGARASGLAPNGLILGYSFKGATYLASVYLKSKDKYEAYLDQVDGEGVIEFFISAKDNEGNIRTVEASFTITYTNETEPVDTNSSSGKNQSTTNHSINTTSNETENIGDGGSNSSGFSIEPLHIIGAGLSIVVILIAIHFVRQRLGER